MHFASLTATEPHTPIPSEFSVLRAENTELREQLVVKQYQLDVYKKLLFGSGSAIKRILALVD